MTGPAREAVERLFHLMVDLSVEEREAIWERERPEPELRRQVERLLELDAVGMETSPFVPTAGRELAPGDRVGPFELLQRIGEGGMGEVWLAEQVDPVRRKVALKLIKTGMDSRQVVARFEAERQALALMEHPAVAKVFDAGTTESGRPYFVMEYVEGVPITEYCDRHRLTNRERLELFCAVCEGVQHAHQKAIIHRDLKPSNILVAELDGRRIPKIIDFGVAKATAQRLTEKTLFTELGVLIGTPEYMSPEQAEVTSEDIDTRTDVYSLGVVLYELLVGALPFDSKTLRGAGFDGLRRMIREQVPPRPSTRLSTLGDRATDSARVRRVALPVLRQQVQGDLDWIVMKALEKDRTRRYETANGLAADIGRYLNNEPTVASPPSAGYRMRKFVRRNRAGVVAASLLAAVLVVGMIGTLWGMTRAFVAAEAESKARREAEQLADFQAGMLEQIDPTTAGVRLTTDVNRRFAEALAKAGVEEVEIAARTAEFRAQWRRVNATDAALTLIDETILSPAVVAIDRRFADQPLVEARLRQVMASRYVDLGLFDAALPLQERALEIRRRELGEGHVDTIASMNQWAELLLSMDRTDEGEVAARHAMEVARRALGDEHPETLRSVDNMGAAFSRKGQLAEAEPYYRDALEGRRRTLGDDHLDTLESINNLAYLLDMQGRFPEAEPYYREALERRRRTLGDDHPSTLSSIQNLGAGLTSQGRFAEAEPYLRGGLEGSRRTLGDDHPRTLTAIGNLGFLLRAQGKFAEAEPHLREALEGKRRVLGDNHWETLVACGNVGNLLRERDRLGEAEAYYREAVDGAELALGPRHLYTLIFMTYLGRVLEEQGRYDEAVALLAPIESAMRDTFTGANAFRVATLLAALGSARAGLVFDADRFALAEANLLEAHALYVDTRGQTHEETLECAQALVDLYSAWHAAEPGAGHAAKSEEWRARQAEVDAAPGAP